MEEGIVYYLYIYNSAPHPPPPLIPRLNYCNINLEENFYELNPRFLYTLYDMIDGRLGRFFQLRHNISLTVPNDNDMFEPSSP
jgi:hypothetical protein